MDLVHIAQFPFLILTNILIVSLILPSLCAGKSIFLACHMQTVWFETILVFFLSFAFCCNGTGKLQCIGIESIRAQHEMPFKVEKERKHKSECECVCVGEGGTVCMHLLRPNCELIFQWNTFPNAERKSKWFHASKSASSAQDRIGTQKLKFRFTMHCYERMPYTSAFSLFVWHIHILTNKTNKCIEMLYTM